MADATKTLHERLRALYDADTETVLPYVEWLEAKLDELVPDCMKDWETWEVQGAKEKQQGTV